MLILQRGAAGPQRGGVAAIDVCVQVCIGEQLKAAWGNPAPIPAARCCTGGLSAGDAAEHASALMMKGRSGEISAITGEGKFSSWAV